MKPCIPDINLILKKFTFTDPGEAKRKYRSISSIQYAAWYGNVSLLQHLLAHLGEETDKVNAFKQLLELKTRSSSVLGLPLDFLVRRDLGVHKYILRRLST